MAGFDFIPTGAIIFLPAMVVAGIILVTSTALFFFYLLVAVRRILRHKR